MWAWLWRVCDERMIGCIRWWPAWWQPHAIGLQVATSAAVRAERRRLCMQRLMRSLLAEHTDQPLEQLVAEGSRAARHEYGPLHHLREADEADGLCSAGDWTGAGWCR